MKSLFWIILIFFSGFYPVLGQAGHQNVDSKKVAIQGYDPVSYFTANQAVKGLSKYNLTFQGAVYYFSTPQNLEKFSAKPEIYVPEYGGWCAFAMGDYGKKVEIDPATFKILNGKLYLFYNKGLVNTLNLWNKNESTLLFKADSNWKTLTTQ